MSPDEFDDLVELPVQVLKVVFLQTSFFDLRQFLRKHFAGDLFQQFALVKLRTDLLHFVEIQPLDLANPLEDSLTLY